MSLKRLLFLSISVALSFCVGVTIGMTYPRTQVEFKNPLDIQQDQILTELSRAVTTLVNCRDFTPLPYYKILQKLVKGPIRYSYDPNMPADVLASTNLRLKVIVLGPSFFDETTRQRERVLAHELLHLVDMPKHADPLVVANDPIYQMINKCYPFDPPDVDEHFVQK